MANTLKHIAGGLLSGLGGGIARNAQDLREERLKELDRSFRREERAEDREFRSEEAATDREFRSGQSAEDRSFRSGERELDRENQRGIAQLRVDASTGNDAASRKMQELINGGVSQDQARKIAFGQLRISRDPTTGEATLIDLGTNEIVPLSRAGSESGPLTETKPAPPTPAPGSAETLFGGADNAVGAIPTIVDTLSGITGQASSELTSPEVTAARQNFNTAQNELIRALSVNPRFPVAEMNRIREEIAIDKGIFNSPDRARIQMRSLDGSLRRRLVQERETSENNSMPVEARKNALQAANDISRFLEVMGVTQIDQMSADELNAMDPGIMTESEIRRAADRLDSLLGERPQETAPLPPREPLLTDSDRASPLPDNLISTGRDIINGAQGGSADNLTPDEKTELEDLRRRYGR